MPRIAKFSDCSSCVNAELDPFQCKGCKNASNWEGFNDLDPDIDTVDDYDDLSEFRQHHSDLD